VRIIRKRDIVAAGCSCRDARESVEELEERCQPNRIKNAIAGPAIEVEVPSPARVVRGSFRRTSQKPTNAARPTASASEQDRASLSSVRQARRVSAATTRAAGPGDGAPNEKWGFGKSAEAPFCR